MKALITPAVLLAVAGCASTNAIPQPTQFTIPPSFAQPTEAVQPVVEDAVQEKKGKFAKTTFRGAAKIFEWDEDQLMPVRVGSNGTATTIQLPPGELPTHAKAVAFGDPDKSRWAEPTVFPSARGTVIGVSCSKPGAKASMTVPTSGRIHAFMLHCVGSSPDMIVRVTLPKAQTVARAKPVFDPSRIDAGYSIEIDKGDSPPWLPIRAFNMGGRKTWIEFADRPGRVGAPNVTIEGIPTAARIDGNFYEIDREFRSAALTLNGTTVMVSKGNR